MIRRLQIGLVVATAVALAGWGLWRWYAPEPPITRAAFIQAPPVKMALPKETIEVGQVKILPKSMSKKLELPAAVANDQRQQILDAVSVPPTKGGATAVSILDTGSGETRTLIREKRRPLFSLEKGGEVGARYGASSEGTTMALFVRQDVARVGNVYLSGYAEVGRDARAMVELSYRW